MVTHTTGVMWLALRGRRDRAAPAAEPLACALPRHSRARSTGAVSSSALGGAGLRRLDPAGQDQRPHVHRHGSTISSCGDLAKGQIAWALQTIGAFPMRNEPAPAIVYVLWLVPFVVLLVGRHQAAPHRGCAWRRLVAARRSGWPFPWL